MHHELTNAPPAGSDSRDVPFPPSEALMRGILDSVVVGVIQFDAGGRVTYANAYAQQKLAATKETASVSLADFIPFTIWPDGSSCPYEDYPAVKALRTGKPQGPSTVGVRYEDDVLWLTISAVPTFALPSSLPDGVVATFVDVSHSRQIEESLRQSEQRYRRLVDNAPDAIVVHQGGTVVYMNQAAVRLWGGTGPAEFIGQSIYDRVHPRFRERVRQRVRQVEGGATTPLSDQLHVALDGRRKRVEVTGMPCVYGGVPCVQVILRDVTERRRVERQVRRQREILRKFFHHIPVLVGIFGKDRRIKAVNRAWKQLLGWGKDLSLDELLDRCFPNPDTRREVAEFLSEAPSGWRDSRVRTQDGRDIDVSAAILRLSDGTHIGIGKDITERKRADRLLRQSKAELEQRVEERTEALVGKNDQLQAEIAERRNAETQLQEKQQILETLLDAHERHRQLVAYEIHDTFVQDLIAALMYLDLYHDTRSDAGDVDLKPVEQALLLARRAVASARETISGLRPPIIDEQGIASAIEYLVSEMRSRGMEIQLHLDVHFGRMPSVLEATVYRIVQEALNNVRRHSRSTFAQVSITQDGDRLRVQIRDHGAGFDPALIPKGHFGVQGIRERARIFGGAAQIVSSPGKGTEILVDLPMRNLAHSGELPGDPAADQLASD
jgi:PAS domain S-box-containing protein